MKKRVNRILSAAFMVVVMLTANVNNSKAATTDAILLFDQLSVSAVVGGSNFNLVARVDPGSNTVDGVNAVQLDITFIPSVVHISSISAVSPFAALGSPDIAAANASGTLSVPLYIAASQVTTISDVATLVFIPQGIATDSPINFASTANAAVNDGNGTPVVSTRTGATVTVTADPNDTTPAIISDGSPSSALTVGTTQATVSVTTDENATCRYATTSGVAYTSMTADTFTTTGTTAHSFVAAGLVDGGSYGYFVRCQDTNNNNNPTDYLISFSVATQSVVSVSSSSSNSEEDSSSSEKKESNTPRKITTSKKVVSRGMILKERGKRFSKNAIVQLYFEKPGGGYHAPVKIKTSSTGSFMVTYRVNKPKGLYGWYAVDTEKNKKSNISYFKVK